MSKANKPMDLTGQKYGKLLVVGYSHQEGKYYYYDCICDCSSGLKSRPIFKTKGKQLRDGSTQSCGCIRSNRAAELPKNNSSIFAKSEIKELPYFKEIRSIWRTNRSHCNPNNGDGHPSYIRKGIKFCDEWDNGFLGFIFFYVWCIKNNYIAGKSQLSRKDKNLEFSPGNCMLIDKPRILKKEAKYIDKNKVTNISLEGKDLKSKLKLINNDKVFSNEEIISINFNKLGVRLIVDNSKNKLKAL